MERLETPPNNPPLATEMKEKMVEAIKMKVEKYKKATEAWAFLHLLV